MTWKSFFELWPDIIKATGTPSGLVALLILAFVSIGLAVGLRRQPYNRWFVMPILLVLMVVGVLGLASLTLASRGALRPVLCDEVTPCAGEPVGCVLAGDDADTKDDAGTLVSPGLLPNVRWSGGIQFVMSWRNEPCDTHGSGWVVGLGSCGSGKGSGLKRCRYVVVRPVGGQEVGPRRIAFR